MSTSEQDFQDLIGNHIGLAHNMLVEHGEFFPYAAAMKPDGQPEVFGGPQPDDSMEPQEFLNQLRGAIKPFAIDGSFRATAVFVNMMVVLPNSDETSAAIAVELDHLDGTSVIVCIPYAIEEGELNPGTIFTVSGENAMFPAVE